MVDIKKVVLDSPEGTDPPGYELIAHYPLNGNLNDRLGGSSLSIAGAPNYQSTPDGKYTGVINRVNYTPSAFSNILYVMTMVPISQDFFTSATTLVSASTSDNTALDVYLQYRMASNNDQELLVIFAEGDIDRYSDPMFLELYQPLMLSIGHGGNLVNGSASNLTDGVSHQLYYDFVVEETSSLHPAFTSDVIPDNLGHPNGVSDAGDFFYQLYAETDNSDGNGVTMYRIPKSSGTFRTSRIRNLPDPPEIGCMATDSDGTILLVTTSGIIHRTPYRINQSTFSNSDAIPNIGSFTGTGIVGDINYSGMARDGEILYVVANNHSRIFRFNRSDFSFIDSTPISAVNMTSLSLDDNYIYIMGNQTTANSTLYMYDKSNYTLVHSQLIPNETNETGNDAILVDNSHIRIFKELDVSPREANRILIYTKEANGIDSISTSSSTRKILTDFKVYRSTGIDISNLDVADFRQKLLKISESQPIRTGSLRKIIRDDLTISESMSKAGRITRAVRDNLTISESLSKINRMFKVVRDDLTISESISKMRRIIRIVNDNLTISESLSKTSGISRVILDRITINESMSRINGIIKIVRDDLTISESMSRVKGILYTVRDNIVISESMSKVGRITRVVRDELIIFENTRRVGTGIGRVFAKMELLGKRFILGSRSGSNV